ncbi:hypothetical protein R1sor_006676 [Riccia sorocarpa]|uniref:Uncharacterized protein n=1 Tax=Riccia sorocarpa TaxID=122646 RepID=A0ABD3HRX9_9MARC
MRNSSVSRTTPVLSEGNGSRGTVDKGEQRSAHSEAHHQQSAQDQTYTALEGRTMAKGAPAIRQKIAPKLGVKGVSRMLNNWGQPTKPRIIPVGTTLDNDDSDPEDDRFAVVPRRRGGREPISKTAVTNLEQINRFQELEATEEPNNATNEGDADMVPGLNQPEEAKDAGQVVAIVTTPTPQQNDAVNDSQEKNDETLKDTRNDVGWQLDHTTEKEYLEEKLEHTCHMDSFEPVGPLAMIIRSLDRWGDVPEEDMPELGPRGTKGRPMDPNSTPDKGNKTKRRLLDGEVPAYEKVQTFS